ncbi:MAG: right-handed parallel beta-helix repeat-containing protein [Phycisphaerales bacterium]|nr:right-handed parallel beta-helix repeat-containing protein [Phycisphaerales bacterium]
MLRLGHVACAAGFVAAVTATTSAGVWYVDATAGAGGDGVSWEAPFDGLEEALAVAQPGDEVWVRAGVYVPSTTDSTVSFVLAPGVSVYGGFNGTETARNQRDWQVNVTTLSGDIGQDDQYAPVYQRMGSNSGHVLVGSNVDATAELDGFVIGYGAIGPPGTFSNDPLMHGSGLYCFGGAPTVRNCTFRYNQAAFLAGGAILLYDTDATIENCRFEYNSVHINSGGGIYSGGASSLTLTDCVFVGNNCTSATPDALGGGLYHQGTGPITISRCTFDSNRVTPFYNNSPAYGGGVAVFTGQTTVTDTTFINNKAGYGGGMILWSPGSLTNCLFIGNEAIETPSKPVDNGGFGGGFMSYSFASHVMTLNNCTFVKNRAQKYSAIYGGWNSTSDVNNCVLWGNIALNPDVAPYWKGEISGNFNLSHSCVLHIFDPSGPGEDPPNPNGLPGCIDVDPQFVDFAGGDYRLTETSPCIDTGITSAVPMGVTTDLDGNARVVDALGGGSIVDMGCYEFAAAPQACPGDADGSSQVDLGDLNIVLFNFGASVTPGSSGDVDGSGTVDLGDLNIVLFNFGATCA